MSLRSGAVWLPLLLVSAAACVTLRESDPVGSVNNPVRVEGRAGEISYLSRLRCESGGAPHFYFQVHGPRGPYGNELDRFGLRCVFDNRSFQVWIDPDHPGHVEGRPVFGLRLAAGDETPSTLWGLPVPGPERTAQQPAE